MADLLLPTTQVNLKDSVSSRGVQSRFISPTPNQGIAFQVDPNRSIDMMKDAVDAIAKYQEYIWAEKEESLVNQANSLYTEVVSQELNRYQNTVGDEAVNGIDEFRENINTINKEFRKTFKNVNMQRALDKQMENVTLNARINGTNWHDKQVIAKAKTEREVALETSAKVFVDNFNSPNDKNNLTQMQYAMHNIIVKDYGISDVNSPEYKKASEKEYDKYFKKSLALQIKENPSMAKANLERVKGLISDEMYRDLKLDVKDEQLRQYKESLHIENLKKQSDLLDEKKRNAEAIALTKPMTPLKYNELYEDYVTKIASKQGKVFHFLPQEEQEQIKAKAKKLADIDRQAWDAGARNWNNYEYGLKNIIQDEVASAVKGGSYNIYAPFESVKSKEYRDMILDYCGGDMKKANELVENLAQSFDRNSSEQGWQDFKFLTPQEKIKLANDPKALSEWVDYHGVPVTHWDEMKKDLAETQQNFANGLTSISKPVLQFKDDFAKVIGEKKYEDVTDDTKRYRMQRLIELTEDELKRQSRDPQSGAVVNPMAYDKENIRKTMSLVVARNAERIEKEADDINDLTDSLYKKFKKGDNALFMKWNPYYVEEEQKHYLKQKILDYKWNNGKLPSELAMTDALIDMAINDRGNAKTYITNDDALFRDVDRENSLFNFKKEDQVRQTEVDTDLGNRSMWNR